MDIAEEIHDIVVAGSGCTGAMAAQTILEKGARVLMIDTGFGHSDNIPTGPKENFLQIRREDSAQYKYWLGKNFESVSIKKERGKSLVTPARRYITEHTEKYLPVISDTFNSIESLSLGGLGGTWGLGCYTYSDKELKEAGLSPNMKEAYQKIADRIGISAEDDDGLPYTLGNLRNIQKPVNIDSNAESIYQKYKIKKKYLNDKGFYLGKPSLALLTAKMDDRNSVSYDEMDYYSNAGLSAYRPEITIEKLKDHPGFSYRPNILLISYAEEEGKTIVSYFNTATGERKSFKCKKLILCTGTLSTARIVLRSMGGQREVKLPLLSDPFKYFGMLQPSMLGVHLNEPRTALAQLMLFHDPEHTNLNVSAASIYSYRSMMQFRAIKELPVNFKDGRILLQYFLPAVSVMGVHHPDSSSSIKYVELVSSPDSVTRDALKIVYDLSSAELSKIRKRERKFAAAMRKLGCYTLKKANPGYGTNAHYAGCLPFSAYKRDFHLHPSGRIYGTSNVFVADGSGFRYLPAKGITLSLMANAHLVALHSLQD